MMRTGVMVAAAVLVAGAAFVAGASVPPRAAEPAARSPDTVPVKAVRAGGSRVGYVNLPRIHREYRKAARLAEQINAARLAAQGRVEALKVKALDVRRLAGLARTPAAKEAAERDLVAVNREIEDATAAAARDGTDKSEAALRELFADIRRVVAAVAREHGMDAVHAFPGDPTTDKPAEIEYILKTPALAPLYLDPDADLTDRVLRRLNDAFDDADR